MKVYTDASHDMTCVVFEDTGDIILEPASYYGADLTVNQAEYYAVLRALRDARQRGYRELDIYTDSQVVVKHMSKATVTEEDLADKSGRLATLRNMVVVLLGDFRKVTFNWVAREDNPAGRVLDP
jgi:ribonuclease HI